MHPIMRDIQSPIETERLLLKMPEPGDGTVINAAIQRSVNELKPWLGFVQQTPTVEDTEINARQAHTKFLLRENLRYLVFRKHDDTLVGSTGFHNVDWDVPKFELGYWMDTEHSGNGYMREAVDALTAYAPMRSKNSELRESKSVVSRRIIKAGLFRKR